MVENIVAKVLIEWCNTHFLGLIAPIPGRAFIDGAVAFELVDEQYPSGGTEKIAHVEIDGSTVIVCPRCKRYYCDRDLKGTTKLTVNLADPDSLPIVLEELFQISFDYCRMLYRQAIKGRRKHLKSLIRDMADLLRQERTKCLETNYQ